MILRNKDQHNSSLFGEALETFASNLEPLTKKSTEPPKVSLDPNSFVGNKNSVVPSTSLDSIEAKTSSNLMGSSRSALMFDRDIYDSLVEDSRTKTDRLRSEDESLRRQAQNSFEKLSTPSDEDREILIQKSSSSLSSMSDLEDNSGLVPGYENSIFDKEAFERLNIHKPELKKDVKKESSIKNGINKQLTSNDVVDGLFSKLNKKASSHSTFTERSIDSLYGLIKNKG